jgi:hypothetical protein
MTIETAQFMLRPLLDHINAGIGIQEKVQHAIVSEGFTLPLLLQGSLRKEIVTRQRAIEKKICPSCAPVGAMMWPWPQARTSNCFTESGRRRSAGMRTAFKVSIGEPLLY